MKQFVLCFSFFIFLLSACKEDDKLTPKPPVDEITLNKIAGTKLIPYQSQGFGGNAFKGVKEDYKVFFDELEIPVHRLTTDSIYVIVPLEVKVGEKNVKLVYKEKEYEFGKVEIIDWKTVMPHNISFLKTQDKNFPFHIKDSASNSVIPYYKDGLMDQIFIRSYTGRMDIIELNEKGLPSMYYNETESVVFDGYDLEKGTVNIAKFATADGISNAVYEYGVPLNQVALQEITEISRGGKLANGRVASKVGEAFGYIGSVFNITGCIVGAGAAIVAPPTTFLTGAGLLLTCTSAAYDFLKIVNPDSDNKTVSNAQTVYAIGSGLSDCLGLVKKPVDPLALYKGIYGCYGLAIEAVKQTDLAYDSYKAGLERDLQTVRATLNSGYGDIKITLSWNTDADLDVWVIEPSNEQIDYTNEISASGGTLDLDDTDGYGPENVFWDTDKSPFGKYIVKVHYYGNGASENTPPTEYKVIINNFGKSKTFTGTLTYNNVAKVAEFTAGAEWGNSGAGGRIAVAMADRSQLKPKSK